MAAVTLTEREQKFAWTIAVCATVFVILITAWISGGKKVIVKEDIAKIEFQQEEITRLSNELDVAKKGRLADQDAQKAADLTKREAVLSKGLEKLDAEKTELTAAQEKLQADRDAVSKREIAVQVRDEVWEKTKALREALEKKNTENSSRKLGASQTEIAQVNARHDVARLKLVQELEKLQAQWRLVRRPAQSLVTYSRESLDALDLKITEAKGKIGEEDAARRDELKSLTGDYRYSYAR